MPTYRITIHNEDFSSCQEVECATADQALKEAIKSTIEIATDPVSSGKPFFGAEVKVEIADDDPVRYIVSIGAGQLKDVS